MAPAGGGAVWEKGFRAHYGKLARDKGGSFLTKDPQNCLIDNWNRTTVEDVCEAYMTVFCSRIWFVLFLLLLLQFLEGIHL